MLMIKVGAALLFVLSLCFATASNVEQLQPGSLCERGEKIVFSCALAKPAKIVSLCSSKELTKDRGYLRYRFGLPGKIELEYPKDGERPQEAFKYSHYFRSLVDETEISFSLNGYEYAIVDDYNGEVKPVHNSQGIRVTPPNNGKEVTLNCRGRAKAQYGDLPEVFP